jgi:hypothetical protein
LISASDIEQPRSPTALREFVLRIKDAVRADDNERHRGILKKDIYKEFLDEIVPLSCFAVLNYPEDYLIRPVLGNQGFDAVVLDTTDKECDRIEVTTPGDGDKNSRDSRLTVERGYGEIHTGKPGYDFDAIIPYVLDTCHRKALKDYSDCTLVVAIEPMSPFTGFENRYESQIATLVRDMGLIQFRAKRVFLLILPEMLLKIKG